ncbi:MAG: BlaI/MecI/CopY family transcriptional regulator [Gemmatimonadaceae bacterium]
MSKKRTSHVPAPTPGELEILRVLWRRGPSTVREVHETLDKTRGARAVGYTTVLKLMQIMAEKGLARRDKSSRTHVYSAAAAENATKQRLVSDLVDRAFEGSALGLVMHALATRPASSQELEQIRTLLREHTSGEKK